VVKFGTPKTPEKKFGAGSSPGGLYNKLLLFALWFSGTGVFFSVFLFWREKLREALAKKPHFGWHHKKISFFWTNICP